MTKIIDEVEGLWLDPFEGDFGDQGDRILRNKIVTSKKGHVCNCCGRAINIGERYRYILGVFEEEFHNFKMCADCLNYYIVLGGDYPDDIVNVEEQKFLERSRLFK